MDTTVGAKVITSATGLREGKAFAGDDRTAIPGRVPGTEGHAVNAVIVGRASDC